ncbi:MAG TPA: FixH family protein [Polyangia bacterium]|nr:FixH family protein [Polyangia bacterium]
MSRIRVTSALAFALIGASGCGSSSEPMVTDADFYSCAEETRATPYQAGMSVTSRDGRFVIKVLDSTWTDPSGNVISEAPAKGINAWTLEVDDAATLQPVDGLKINVTPRMPDHRHGTKTVAVTAAGGGVYALNPLYLYMVGYWEITLDMTDAAGATAAAPDSAMFHLCVSG